MMYLKIGILVICFIAGWMVKGWKVDAGHKDAMEQQVEDFNIQREEDQKEFRKELLKRQKVKKVFIKVKEEIENVPDTPIGECTVDISYKRVWNSTIDSIGEALTNSLHGSLRTTFIHENRLYRLQGSGKGSVETSWRGYEDTYRMY